jgi:dipeptidase E
MRFYLSSYKLGHDTGKLVEWRRAHGNRILIISNSKDQYTDTQKVEDGVMFDSAQLTELGFDVTRLDLKDYFRCSKELAELIKDYNGFYVVGGNTFVLRRAFKLSGFDRILLSLKSNPDYIYIGYSAGVCVLCSDLRALAPVDDPDINPYEDMTPASFNGVGIIDYIILPHYKSAHPESPAVDACLLFAKRNKLPHKTLRDGQVIILDI